MPSSLNPRHLPIFWVHWVILYATAPSMFYCLVMLALYLAEQTIRDRPRQYLTLELWILTPVTMLLLVVIVVLFAMLERRVMRPTALPTVAWEMMRLPSIIVGVMGAVFTLMYTFEQPPFTPFAVFVGGFAGGWLQTFCCHWSWRRSIQFGLASGLGLLLANVAFELLVRFSDLRNGLSLARATLILSMGGIIYGAVTGYCLIRFASEDAAGELGGRG